MIVKTAIIPLLLVIFSIHQSDGMLILLGIWKICESGITLGRKSNPDAKSYSYKTPDPVTILCVHQKESGPEFIKDQIFEHGQSINSDFISKLKENKRKKLTINVVGMAETVEMFENKNDQYQQKAFEWFNADKDMDICYVLYAYQKLAQSVMGFMFQVFKMPWSGRFAFTAHVTYLLAHEKFNGNKEEIQKYSQYTGFSLGVHIVGQSTELSQKKDDALPLKAIYWDPAGVRIFIGAARMAKPSNAKYVMAVHSDVKLLANGTKRKTGHVSIHIINFVPENLDAIAKKKLKAKLHHVPVFLGRLVAANRIKICATKGVNGPGRLITIDDKCQIDECAYGVHWSPETGLITEGHQIEGVYSIDWSQHHYLKSLQDTIPGSSIKSDN